MCGVESMSREPRGVTQRRVGSAGVPYRRPEPKGDVMNSTALVQTQTADETAGPTRGPRRLTFNNMETFNAREKKLPPDANVEAAMQAKLLQLAERASFYCNKCRRDNIISDSLAVDVAHHMMLCTRCFTRIIRPRTYRPSRVVPFPSLLSWLNYKPSTVMEMSEDVTSRPAEAVAPSGERIAAPTLTGGDRPMNLKNLPAIAMNTTSSNRGMNQQQRFQHQQQHRFQQQQMRQQQQQQMRQQQQLQHQQKLQLQQQQQLQQMREGTTKADMLHPCCRVWGRCVHGETCLFHNAPHDLCICFLMGLCPGNEEKCGLLHQRVFDLPNTSELMPSTRRKGEADDPNSAWGRWMSMKLNSPNRAEWQLWHNGSVMGLLDAFAPIAPEEERSEKEETDAKPAVKLNFADISAALKGLKQ